LYEGQSESNKNNFLNVFIVLATLLCMHL